jgi:hypothetical protein
MQPVNLAGAALVAQILLLSILVVGIFIVALPVFVWVVSAVLTG